MGIEVSHDSPEEAAEQFQLAAAAVGLRFAHAVARGRRDEDSRYVLLDSHPRATHPLGVFALVADYELFLAGRSERLELGVPLVEADAENPISVLGDSGVTAYFTLAYGQRSLSSAQRIDVGTWRTNRRWHQLPLPSLAEKVLGYALVPMRIDDTGDAFHRDSA